MKPLSKIAAGVSPSATLAVSALAKKMKAEGKDVIGFGAGEPDFATPDRISYAGVRAICDGKTRYTPAAGMIELRQAICDRVKADYGLEYEPTQAVVASGAKHMVYIALAALVDPGDEVIVPSPYWVSYYEMVRLFGGVPVVEDAVDGDFQPHLHRLGVQETVHPGVAHGDEPGAVPGEELLQKVPLVGIVPERPGEGFAHHAVDSPLLDGGNHALEALPAVVGAGEAVVHENLFQLPGALELLLQVVHENFPLILYTEALRPAVLPGQPDV